MKRLKSIILFVPVLLALHACQPDSIDPVTDVAPPTGVKLLSAGNTTLTFVWDEVGDAEYYVGRLESPEGDLVTSGQVTVKENTVTYSNLGKGMKYLFKVRVRVNGADSEYSSPVEALTEDYNGVEPVPSEKYAEFKIPASEDQHAKALAFPGAEGGGMFTTGGRGGKVIHVTTLADSGTGSLRSALAETGARTIVFDVAGLIELKSALKISKGDVTIAGQTAPGDGICIKNFTTQVSADNVIIRFVRFRLGLQDIDGDGADAVWGRYNENLILDHCSMSWSIDECASFYANKNFTMQWCILTESLKKAGHSKGDHGYGGIWGGNNASFHHNMLANHDSRNPRIDHPQVYGDYVSTHRGNVDYRNNAVYNWGSNSTYGGEDGWFNIVNNYYKPGPASRDRKYFVDAYGSYVKNGVTYADSYPELYLSGNVHTKHSDISSANDASAVYWHSGSSYGNYNMVMTSPHSIVGPADENVYTTTHSAELAFQRICSFAGASIARDAVDQRACADALAGTATFTDGGNGSTGGIIDTPTAVGGWPSYEATAEELAAVKDSDGDGMPDWFEVQFGLDKSDDEDGNAKTLDTYGRYTNLEMYLHYLVRDIVEEQNAGGTYNKLS